MASQSFIDDASASPSRPTAVPIQLDGIRVLLVDDDPDQLATFSDILVGVGAIVDAASSAHEAIHVLARSVPDVIVSDIHMPECDGYHLLRMVRARSISQGGATPAIALTAQTKPADRTRALLAGYQVHLAKPIRPVELLVAIRGIVDARSAPAA